MYNSLICISKVCQSTGDRRIGSLGCPEEGVLWGMRNPLALETWNRHVAVGVFIVLCWLSLALARPLSATDACPALLPAPTPCLADASAPRPRLPRRCVRACRAPPTPVRRGRRGCRRTRRSRRGGEVGGSGAAVDADGDGGCAERPAATAEGDVWPSAADCRLPSAAGGGGGAVSRSRRPRCWPPRTRQCEGSRPRRTRPLAAATTLRWRRPRPWQRLLRRGRGDI